MSILEKSVLPVGSRILVTGVNSYIGMHVADKFLKLGYNVNGLVRTREKQVWTEDYFHQSYRTEQFRASVIEDLCNTDSLTDCLKGISAIVHLATPFPHGSSLEDLVREAANGTLSLLNAAHDHESVIRVVLTSSSVTAGFPSLTEAVKIDQDSWNDKALCLGKSLSGDDPMKWLADYAASKTKSEKVAWEWYRNQSPHFVMNTVLPSTNFGTILHPSKQGLPSTSALTMALYNGQCTDAVKHYPPHWFVDVEDCARLHVMAAIHPDVKGIRLFAYGEKFSLRRVGSIMKSLYPGRYIPTDLAAGDDQTLPADRDTAENLLREWGCPGWTSLEQSIKNTLTSVIPMSLPRGT